jgi:demethylmenaquinone methyltransferase/2-methoxy-6-polyprenyl-1,4-benzoquinol methylase
VEKLDKLRENSASITHRKREIIVAKTDFGFKKVDLEEKAKLVRGVFDSVAGKYDVMNDFMSLGVHRLWKKIAIDQAGVRAGQRVLDIAGGTGDLAKQFVKRVGDDGLVVLADINHAMLSVGRSRLIDQGRVKNLQYVQTDAQHLAFPDNYFDCVTIAFGLRNVTDKQLALESMHRVLKPGGRLLVLEFSKVVIPQLKKIYDLYSFKLIPKIGSWVTGDKESYEYLVESIRMHPDQETLKDMMLKAGFEKASYKNLTGGIVAIHEGIKASA